jgi:hypothetical protein
MSQDNRTFLEDCKSPIHNCSVDRISERKRSDANHFSRLDELPDTSALQLEIPKKIRQQKFSRFYYDFELGTALNRLQLIDLAQLEYATNRAELTGVSLSSLLIAEGFLTKNQLKIGVQAHSLLKDGIIDEDTLSLVAPHLKKSPISLDEVLKRVLWYQHTNSQRSRLGDLLTDARVVSKLSLVKAMAYQSNSLQPLGLTLVFLGILSQRVVSHALLIQERIRKGLVTREAGLRKLRLQPNNRIVAESSEKTDHSRIGDLAVESGILTEEQIEFASIIALWKSQLIGEALIRLRFLSQSQLAVLLDGQRLYRFGVLKRHQTIKALKLVDQQTSWSEAIEKAIFVDEKQCATSSKVFAEITSNSPLCYRPSARHLSKEISRGVYTIEEAMHIFSICTKDNCSVQQALGETGWTVDVRPKTFSQA